MSTLGLMFLPEKGTINVNEHVAYSLEEILLHLRQEGLCEGGIQSLIYRVICVRNLLVGSVGIWG